jgi:ribonuclease R
LAKVKRKKNVDEQNKAKEASLPTKQDILAFIAEHPGKAGKREISRAFGITGGARIALKRMLKELSEEGLVEKQHKKLIQPGELPKVFTADIIARDPDGLMIAEPADWNSQSEEKPPRVLILDSTEERKKSRQPQAGMGDRVLLRLQEGREGTMRLANVIRRIERPVTRILGIYRERNDGGFIEPIERNKRELLIPLPDKGDAQHGDLVSVMPRRSGRYGPTIGKVLGVVGEAASEKAISMIAIHANDIPFEFPESVLREAQEAEAPPEPSKTTKREDWRAVPLVTIDPPDAKDHDDAVFAEPDDAPDNEGGMIVTVAIADVSWHVRPGSAMDKEALKRGNSVYFPDRVVPMLPERISNDLCSLREGEDRPALAVRLIFNKAGKKIRHSFHRIMMRSHARLSYQQAQTAIDGNPDEVTEPLLEPILKPLWHAYEIALRSRNSRSPLELDVPERKVILNNEGRVDRIHVPERLDAHKLIEEFMIQANVAAAETLEAKRSPVMYRIHDTPSLAKLESLREFLKSIEIDLPKAGNLRPSHFNSILGRVKGTEHDLLVNEVMLRSQSQAEYSPANIGHFGLNLHKYAHFTSPIRRYADLIVHRALVSALNLGKGGLPHDADEKLTDIAEQISKAERRAMAAERQTIDRLIAIWLSEHVGARFSGRVSGVIKSGLFVKLDDTGADGYIPAATLGNDFYVYEEANHRLTGRATGESYRLGDPVQVKLVEALPFAGALRFEMLSEGHKVATRGKRRQPARQGKPGKPKHIKRSARRK